MFIELTLYSTEEKVLINIDHICAIYPFMELTNILVGKEYFGVKESYEDIVNCLDKCLKYRK